MKRLNCERIISLVFIIILTVVCSHYILKYQETNRQLSLVEKDLEIANEVICSQIENFKVMHEELMTANSTIEDLKNTEYELVYMGDYKLTAYCACEICCEEWALSRPLDTNGNPIVYTATGTVATQGRTIGVDPKVIPYGTEVYIEGLGWRVAEDTGAIQNQHIDVYMDSHDAALHSGLTHGDVWILLKKP